jgi:hypothetical protein
MEQALLTYRVLAAVRVSCHLEPVNLIVSRRETSHLLHEHAACEDTKQHLFHKQEYRAQEIIQVVYASFPILTAYTLKIMHASRKKFEGTYLKIQVYIRSKFKENEYIEIANM